MAVPVIAALAGLVPAGIDAGFKIADRIKADRKAADRPVAVLDTPPPAAPRPASSRTAAPRRGGARPTPDQVAAIEVIAKEFKRASLPAELAGARVALTMAAVVNAYAESRWNPAARNTRGEDSVGLFQANRQGGLGTPFTVAQLQDPAFNTRVIIAEVRRRAGDLAPAAQRGSLADLVAAFTVHIERPADRVRVGRERAQIAREWFGSRANARAWGWRTR